MLQLVSVSAKSIRDYVPVVGEDLVEDVYRLARPLRGARVLHLNATAFGGGVAEILSSLVPLMNDAGLNTEWRVIYGTDPFFNVTKSIHNALQGAPVNLSSEAERIYLEINKLNAEAFRGEYDFVVVHDPQPAAMLSFLDRRFSKHWIWRCHIDTSEPSETVLDFVKPYLEQYDAGIFTLPSFVPAALRSPRTFFITPTIDPLSPKNLPLSLEEARRILACFKVDTSRPLVTQVSRFDPWKDPLGVIDAYRMVKVELPQLQLALVGSMATDDPEGWDYYARTLRHAGNDEDIHIFHNFQGVSNVEVNAFQRASDVVVQKSTREGFGLVVTEALWKARPVVAGNVGGIPLQVIEGDTGFLVQNALGAAERIYQLLTHPDLRERLGQRAREHVRRNFLSPHHLRSYLQIFANLSQ
ncbi:MAG: glycosyltransferase [Chloroflexi bacterium]|nr:glycosyltransferase [Chloroflexota bacterium]